MCFQVWSQSSWYVSPFNFVWLPFCAVNVLKLTRTWRTTNKKSNFAFRPRLNKGMKILVLSKNFSASSCNIFSTFQMFKTDIWFFGFFPEFQLNYFWKKMFSRYRCLKFYLTILKFLAKWMVVNIIFCFQLGHVSSCLLDRPFSEALRCSHYAD